MPTNEKRREAAKRKLDRQLARRAERAKARRRYAVAGSVAAVVLVVGVVTLIVSLGSRDQPANTATPSSPSPTPTATGTTEPQPTGTVAGPPTRPQPLPASVDCQYAGTQQTPAKPVTPPPAGPTTAQGTVSATMQTSSGPIGLTLDRALAPCTVHSFVSLARQGFYSDSPCHRLVTNPGLQVLQCGDPTGSGSGGPGYAVADEVFPELTYPRGYVAMANAGPNTSGSQFFLIYGDSQLPPQYTVFATVSPDGLKVIDQIAKAGSDGSLDSGPGGGKPNEPIKITSVDIVTP